MTFRTLILHSLRHHARSHLGGLLGAAVGSAVLVGALLVGDSVRGSLREMALARLGSTEFVMATGDRFFTRSLDWILPSFVNSNDIYTVERLALRTYAPIIQLPAIVSRGDGEARANNVQLMGVEHSFWHVTKGNAPRLAEYLSTDSPPRIGINRPLSDHLRVKEGDTVLIRIPKPSKLSPDAPLSPEEDTTIAMRLTVGSVFDATESGNFSLQANQSSPFNVFISLSELQKRLEMGSRANLLLVGSNFRIRNSPAAIVDQKSTQSGLDSLSKALRSQWSLADAEMELLALTNRNAIELRTSRVFIDQPVVEAALKAAGDAQPLLTYFVNELRAGDKAAPYSMVTAAGAPLVPVDMKDDEILINQWLADDLGVKPGDALSLAYYIVGNARKLEERTNTFRIRAVVPMELPWADPTLMPDFPGLKDAENCRDWDTGFPIAMDRIREHDNKYWEDRKGTPKAFVTLAAGQKMWANRFGSLTAVRFPATPSVVDDVRSLTSETPNSKLQTPNNSETPYVVSYKDKLEKAILANLDPASVGLVFQPVREQALKAVNEAQDFGGLFIGFSFFLIVAALLLMAMLFQFGIEQRAQEIGTLLALGFTPKQVRRLLLGEGAVLSLLGGLLGLAGGIAYAKAMLWGLTTLWRDAVGTTSLAYHAEPKTLVIGAVAGTLVGLFTIWLAVRKQAARPARELLSEGAGMEIPNSKFQIPHTNKAAWLALGSFILALAMIGFAAKEGSQNPGLFFGAGSLLLIAALATTSALLSRLQKAHSTTIPSLGDMGFRNATRQRKRSLATVAMLACGSFLVVAVGANKLDANRDATKRSSGTGGFALIGETTLPVIHDLNTQAGREFFGLDEKDLKGVSFVPFRVREGDDASCLNLNRAQKPRVLGVNAGKLAGKEAFTFASRNKQLAQSANQPWQMLAGSRKDAVPAIGDAASIQWALGKKIGDDIPYLDERGNTFNLRLVGGLANSILQGSLIISEDEFVKRFPSEAGYRMFLIDAPSEKVADVSAKLSKALQDVGLELTPAPQRLAQFNAVQNTYLSTFQVLGGLGLLLGSVGLGVVVLRNVLERRGELALLRAVGFREHAVRWLVMSEHGALLMLGLLGGVIAAVVAVLPALLSPGAQIPYASLAATLGAVLVSGAIWTWLAARVALRGRLLDALRNE
jgi:putative ABC transport system permease protein